MEQSDPRVLKVFLVMMERLVHKVLLEMMVLSDPRVLKVHFLLEHNLER
jgi:hypothetical protein